NAVFGVMIPQAAVLQARGEKSGLGRIVIVATRYSVFLLLITGLPLIFGATRILDLWVGPSYAIHGARILRILVIANMIRLSAVPYVMVLVGSGEQKRIIFTPILEAVTNLIASILGGFFFGAIGVAVGTLLGALVGVTGNLFYNMPRTTEITFNVSD